MTITFDQARAQIVQLVRHFDLNLYRAPDYKEAHARQDFIDPMFIALGWDVHNVQHAAPHYREVVVEASLDVEGSRKAPDYAFRVGRETKFFTEAKKPGVSIRTSAGAAYQLRRYAWSLKLPLSLLTDFEELAVYDCRTRPSEKDKATTGRIQLYTYQEYPDRWRELWDVFSREAALSGAFDQFAQTSQGKRGASAVDAEFLKEVEAWRDALARNVALRNPRLTVDELNDAVQRTIDRIIFLRMAEDRGMEEYEQLRRLAYGGEGMYAGLIDLCRKADARYNSGLFDFGADKLTPALTVDDKTLKPILSNLYFPASPYEFSVLPTEILGNVYEQFLGKVIRLTPAHQAKVEEKPAVRKAGGVYYTPTYIVEYIVRNTVGKLVEGKSPKQLEAFRVLDMACGSGSFLLGAYQYLLDYYAQWYAREIETGDRDRTLNGIRHTSYETKLYRTSDGAWRLTTAEKKRILTAHIFGVDIDRQAVEVTKLSLLLKVLEGESDETLGKQLALFQERALPNLDRNIKCGNSLIGPDYFTGQLLPDADELRRVNPFDWEREFPAAMKAGGPSALPPWVAGQGFDCIIGNPPYIRIQTMKEWAPLEVEAYKQLYTAASKGNYDIYVVFVERGLSLLNERGRLGFILPHKFFNAQYGQPVRELLAKGRHLAHIVHFGDQQVFAGATTYTSLMFLDKAGRDECEYVKVDDLAAWRANQTFEVSKDLKGLAHGIIPASSITAAEWNFSVGHGAGLFERLSRMPVKLGDVAARMAQGIRTSANEVYVLDLVSVSGNLITAHSKQLDQDVKLERKALSLFLQGREIKPYRVLPSGKMIIIPYCIENGRTILISEKELRDKFPKMFAYLSENKTYLENRERGRMRGANWYAYVYPKNIDVMAASKILVPDIADRASFALDETGEYAFTSGYGIILKSDVSESPKYVLGLLNSKVLDFYLKRISTTMRGGFFRYFTQFIEQLPIRPIVFSDPADAARHERMVTLVEQMLELHKRQAAASQADRELYQRQIDATDREIDKLVYGLYNLTAEDIRIIEGDTS